ncbi:hypothetical protein [Microbulbifer taiwanensis]|uniref:Uncharacterized protein n=1 Tax=Microbulbifer taiwanensis TaxID=986746 RepID=A0ABW1YMR2_9GAMM|nr:hypothetical protein [Microbulbifer taiwanensis]
MYKSEFEAAIERTKKFNLPCPPVEYSSELLLTDNKMNGFVYALRDSIGELEPKEVVAQCLSIHYRVLDVVSNFFKTDCYFTIGYVESDNGTLFYQSENDLKNILINGADRPSLSIHAWLTLPTMEILDFSLPTSFAIINNIKEGIGGLIARHADRLINGVKYHPMLIGEDFLRESGLLIEFGISRPA